MPRSPRLEQFVWQSSASPHRTNAYASAGGSSVHLGERKLIYLWKESLEYHSVVVGLLGRWRVVWEDVFGIEHHLISDLKK